MSRGGACIMVRTLPRKMIFLLFIAAILVPVVCLLAATESRNSAKLSLREAMIRILGSTNPNPSLGDEAQTFDRLIGSWDADFSFPQSDGTVRHKKRICGLPIRQQPVRNARLGQRFGSLIRRSNNGALCSSFQNIV